MKTSFLTCLFLLLFGSSYAQTKGINGRYFSVEGAYLELKDELNHGLVYRGPDIRLHYGYQQVDSNRIFDVHASIGGGGKTTTEIWGGTWLLSPLNLSYGFKVFEHLDAQFFLGPSLQANYLVQNYPAMHAGPINWLSSYEIGPQINYFLRLGNRSLALRLYNSFLALNSRPILLRDPYYFTTSISENFGDLHSNLALTSLNKYNQTEFEVSLFLLRKKRTHAIGYTFQYVGHFPAPRFTQVFHGLKYSWYAK